MMVMTVERFVDNVQLFFLIFMRMAAIFVETPLLGSRLIPWQIRGAIAFLITLIVFPPVAAAGYTYAGAQDAWMLGWAVINEIAIGLLIGFVANLYLLAFQLAGQFFSVQLGFGIVEVLDPMAEISVPIIGQLQSLFATLVFIAIGGHVYLLQAVLASYRMVPALAADSAGKLLVLMTGQVTALFEISFILAAPVLGTVFITEVALGIMTRTAPQMNIMMLGFPIKIVLGLLVLITVLPPIEGLTERLFETMFRETATLLKALG